MYFNSFLIPTTDGSGYVEDGRDIFDDDLDEESINKNASKSEKSKKRPRAVSKAAGTSDGPSGSSIRSMLMSMPVKKKVEVCIHAWKPTLELSCWI